MQIQLNTDKHIDGNQQLAAEVREVVESTLARFSDHITRVDVHLSDENSGSLYVITRPGRDPASTQGTSR